MAPVRGTSHENGAGVTAYAGEFKPQGTGARNAFDDANRDVFPFPQRTLLNV
jgi:hypothetical protein